MAGVIDSTLESKANRLILSKNILSKDKTFKDQKNFNDFNIKHSTENLTTYDNNYQQEKQTNDCNKKLLRPNTTKVKVISELSSDFTVKQTKLEVKNQIKEYFEDPAKYFDMGNIIVNKKPRGFINELDNNGKIIRRKYIDENTSEANANVNRCSTSKKSRKNSIFILTPSKEKECHVEILDSRKVENIFLQAEERIYNKNKNERPRKYSKSRKSSKNYRTTSTSSISRESKLNKNSNSNFLRSIQIPVVPNKSTEILKHELNHQEKILKLHKEREIKSAKLSRAISAKTKHKCDDLLMNKTDTYRFKKQIVDVLDKQRSVDEKYGDNSWMLALRRDGKEKWVRTAHVNIGSNECPIWKQLQEFPKKDQEIISIKKPDKQLNKVFSKPDYKSAMQKANLDLGNINNIGSLVVQGKNLLKHEYEAFNECKKEKFNNKFKIYSDPLAVKEENYKNELYKHGYN